MGYRSTASLLALMLLGPPAVAAQSAIVDQYRDVADRIIEAALADSTAYERLTELVDRFGHRFSGSVSLERAIDWILEEMRVDGLDNVHGEPVMVPHWVRGRESAELIEPRRRTLPVLGLGGSVGTPPQGVRAQVLVVESFAELRERAAEAPGKIVLFDAPWDGYGPTVQYRTRGADAAAAVGAVASMIRSVTPYSQQTPHTGVMSYGDSVPRIPHAAITPEDASMIHRMQERGGRIVVRLMMEAQTLPDVESRNLVGELLGSTLPNEAVILGGHIDSWDVGQGAMDDAGGVVAAWEAVRLLHDLGLRPRRSIRVVGWTNEENGLAGANAYRDAHLAEIDDIVLAIESDAGVFKPLGFGFGGTPAAYEVVREVGRLLDPIDAGDIRMGGGGADIGPLMRAGVPGMGLTVDGTRYFWYHHTEADTIDKLDPREMAECVAAMAVMAYVIADLPEKLPR